MAELYILCGQAGSGKTTFAKTLEKQGFLRLCLDEEVLKMVKDHRDPNNDLRAPADIVDAAQLEIIADHKTRIRQALLEDISVVVEDGFWRKTKRDDYKRVAESVGADWRLLYFEIDPETQWERLDARNQGDLSGTHFVSRDEMNLFATMFEEPIGEGEEPPLG